MATRYNDEKTKLLLELCEDHYIIERGQCEELLSNGADPNSRGETGWTPLMWASLSGMKWFVELLLHHKANVNMIEERGSTALHYASSEGHVDIVSALIEGGASVHEKNKLGNTALHDASIRGHAHAVSALMKGGATNEKNKNGDTALHLASYQGHAHVVSALIEGGATTDEKNEDGDTALHIASRYGCVDIVKALIEGGASVHEKNKSGKTPLDYARDYAREYGNDDEIVNLFETGNFTDDVSPSEQNGEGTSHAEPPREDSIKTYAQAPLGHILTKFELQVLSGLLDAYSNEKIKEIQRSIQKKQGGDISREEVETSLRQGGQTTVADELEQNLHKGVEKAEHYKAYQAALEGAKTITLRYLRFLLIGIPRSGKSTMRRRMLQEIINLSSLGQQSVSTGVAETYDVLVKLTSESAAISGSNWWSLKKKQSSDASQPNSNDEGDLHHLTHLFYSLISKPASNAPQRDDSTTSSQSPTNEATDNSKVEESITATIATGIVADTDRNQETIHTSDKPVAVEPAGCDRSGFKDVDSAFKKLTDILHTDSPEDLHKLLLALTLINLMDIGGQPEFLDMLPAVTIGSALYLLFFRLDQDLHEHYPVTFLAPGDTDEKPLETSYCIEEVIHKALASIACFSGQFSKEKVKEASRDQFFGEEAESAPSRAILIGTYKDKVKAEDIARKEEEVSEKFKMYEDLLLLTEEGKPFFAVDNMNGTDESEMSRIRRNIHKIVKTFFAEVPIPASWLMFRIVLHLLNKPVVTLVQCEEIAHRLSMPTPVQEALWFFHHNIGSLLYYPEIPSVKDLVICTPQVIFDSVTTVIIDNFRHGQYRFLPKVMKQFQQTGVFSLSDISKKTEMHRSTHLTPNQLVDVLKHSGILAEVKCDDQEATSSGPVEPKFIIPAVLKQALEEELQPSSSLEACPLMIRFEGGFVPFGVFSASVARLIANADSFTPKWILHGDEVKKNKVQFLIARAFIATLISRPQYLEIQIARQSGAAIKHELTSVKICSTVREKLVETLESTISKMNYRPQGSIAAAAFPSNQRPFHLAFTCCLESHSDHLMKIENGQCPKNGECLKGKFNTELGKEHLLWFDKDKSLSQSEATAATSVSSASSESDMNSRVTINLDNAPVSLDDEVEVFKLFRESFRNALLADKPHLGVCWKHNKKLFTNCLKKLRYDCKRNTCTSKGKLLDRLILGKTGHFEQSGKLTVVIEKREIEEMTKTVNSNTEGGFTIAGVSLKQTLQASISAKSGVHKGKSFKFDLDFKIEEGKTADVTPVIDIYDMETEVIGLSVTPPDGSKLSYHEGDQCPHTRQDVDIPKGKKIEIFGTYRWLHTPIDVVVQNRTKTS